MKIYLGKKFLFVEMHQRYSHCVVEGEDRVICCQKSLGEAQRVCAEIRSERFKKVEQMQRLLDEGHQYDGKACTMFGCDIRSLYPTAGLLFGAVQKMKKAANSVRVEELRTEA